MLWKEPTFLIGWYCLIGLIVYWLVPMTPKAKEAFDAARGVHRHGDILVVLVNMIFWPLVVIGRTIKFLRGPGR